MPEPTCIHTREPSQSPPEQQSSFSCPQSSDPDDWHAQAGAPAEHRAEAGQTAILPELQLLVPKLTGQNPGPWGIPKVQVQQFSPGSQVAPAVGIQQFPFPPPAK
ncbi:hypothetical protein A2V80_03445 [Candidatus Woesebacteria bacterium RBG_16_39_8b]|uniref:Uncharacterized protein n=1 Tax=Candidatus Woesebacteria bacterium RBG_16_39_8b TaxID=1802482 RepID=A0A1F7XDN6_9BACT|nr:MAG: hypothetical protein A2V80_03445 [Candidatus Woesebacteria bacterium RBG_16_39_8b]